MRRRCARHSVAHAWPRLMRAHAAPPRSHRSPHRPSPLGRAPTAYPRHRVHVKCGQHPGCRWPSALASPAPAAVGHPPTAHCSIRALRSIASVSPPRASIASHSAAIDVLLCALPSRCFVLVLAVQPRVPWLRLGEGALAGAAPRMDKGRCGLIRGGARLRVRSSVKPCQKSFGAKV